MDMQRVPVREAFYEARFIGNRCYMPPMQKYPRLLRFGETAATEHGSARERAAASLATSNFGCLPWLAVSAC